MRATMILWPFAALMLVMGVAPMFWITPIENRNNPLLLKGSAAVPQVTVSLNSRQGVKP